MKSVRSTTAITMRGALNPIFLVVLLGAIEGLLLWYIHDAPQEFLSTCVITMMAFLVGEASDNLGIEGVANDPTLQRGAITALLVTLFLFAVVVAMAAKGALLETDDPPVAEYAVALAATIPTWGFRAYARSAVVE